MGQGLKGKIVKVFFSGGGGQGDIIRGRLIVLHVSDSDSILGTTYGSCALQE